MITVATAAAGYVLPSARASRASMPMMSLTGEQELFAKFGVPSPEEYVTTRRTALSLGVGVGVATTMPFFGAQPAFADDGMFSVPPLPYAYDALEPTIDAATMKVIDRTHCMHAHTKSLPQRERGQQRTFHVRTRAHFA